MNPFFTAPHYELERQTCWNIIIAVIVLGIAALFLYQGFFSSLPIGPKMVPYVFVLIVGLALNGIGVWYLLSFQDKATCMTGCMGGMTVGMGAGFSLGAVVGATNGMLYGSIYGFLVSMALGALAGRCGPMGRLQGLMAGFMGGTMGAMTAVMLANDFLLGFLGVILGANVLFLAFLFHVFRLDMGATPQIKSPPIATVLAILLIVLLISMWLIGFGPRSTFSLSFLSI